MPEECMQLGWRRVVGRDVGRQSYVPGAVLCLWAALIPASSNMEGMGPFQLVH